MRFDATELMGGIVVMLALLVCAYLFFT